MNRRRRLKRSGAQALVRSVGTLTLDEFIARLGELREHLGGNVPVVVGKRGFQLACGADTVSWPDLEDDELVHRAVRICGI